jgi:excinuclease ABC subunit A
MQDFISIKGARENNLKNITLEIPKNKLVVLTGLSGSGKSTLAFDTLQKECQRLYMESMGMVTDFVSKPKVDSITGLSPSISIDQYITNRSPRSTVGTVTDLYTFLRVIFAKLGKRPCPKCGKIIEPEYGSNGDSEIGAWGDVDDSAGSGVEEEEIKADEADQGNSIACPHCKAQLLELTASSFSFNKPQGACPACTGLGVVNTVNISMLIDEDLSLADGAVNSWDDHLRKWYKTSFESAEKHYGFEIDFKTPVKNLGTIQRDFLFYGALGGRFRRHFPRIAPPKAVGSGCFEGVATSLLRKLSARANDAKYRDKMAKFIIQDVCPDCGGDRLREESRSVIVNRKSIVDITKMSLGDLMEWLRALSADTSKEAFKIVKPIVFDMNERLKRLIDVGLRYLTLDRSAPTLSSGEAQRLRLALVLGSGLTGVLYVLDEPTIGLHSRDTENLIDVLSRLRELGNTVLVIEHDLDMMKAADYIIDIGPGAGKNGGRVVAVGTPKEVSKCEDSLTGVHLAGKAHVLIRKHVQRGNDHALTVKGACAHNLKHINVSIPLGKLVVITGVSGAGKSSLLFDVLDTSVRHFLDSGKAGKGDFESVSGLEHIDNIVTIDQSPIGRTVRSNAATYTDAFTPIRNLFAGLPESERAKLKANHFSFNVPGGRCEKCQGAGVLSVSMYFLPEVQVRCPACNGRRFKKEVLSVKYKNKDISDILNLTIREAIPLFAKIDAINDRLSLMAEVGLEYLQLGQPANTLSGGEAQRIKLAKELSKRGKGHILYLLDEPTTGLHPHDVGKLLTLLMRLVDSGNTVIIVEHNIDVIKAADWIIDMGPEGGDEGGEIVAEGSPNEIVRVKASYTGKFIAASME